MIVAIHQPNYLPWLGYFHKISAVDTFVFFDNVQMPIGKSFVSRNRIKTPQGEQWLTVPTHRDSNGRPIAETAIQPGNWPRKHLMTIRTAYAGSPWLGPVLDGLQREFGTGEGTIADLNIRLVRMCAAFIGLTAVKFLRATEMGLASAGAESVYEILDRTEAKTYVTGAGAGTQRTIDEDVLAGRGVAVRYLPSAYPQYPQRRGAFIENLSILDAMLNCGPEGTRALIGAASPSD